MPSQIADVLEPNEFVHFVLHGKGPNFVVTNRRLLTHDKTGLHVYVWKDVVSIERPINEYHKWAEYYSHHFTMVTFKGDIRFNFQSTQDAVNVYTPSAYALGNYTSRRQDIATVIISLKSKEPRT